jgi:CubicO group peptidase (beta-lactamase class C family)
VRSVAATQPVDEWIGPRGQVDFDKLLHGYVPALTDALSKKVTARHVLSHSSG